MNEYIDVRGIHPIYFKGNKFIRLVGFGRDTSITLVHQLIVSGKIQFEN